MNAKQTTKTTAEMIRKMDEQNQALFQRPKAPETKGFKEKTLGRELYQIDRKTIGDKANGKTYLFLGLKKSNRFYSVYVNRDSLIQAMSHIQIGDYIVNPLLQRVGKAYTLDTMPEAIQTPEEIEANIPKFNFEGKIWDIDIRSNFINLVIAQESKTVFSKTEIRNMKNQARSVRRAGDKGEFNRLNKAIEQGYKVTYSYKRASLPYGTGKRLIGEIQKAYKGKATDKEILESVKSYTFKNYPGECNISGIIEENGKYTNYRIRSINPIEEWENADYLKMQLDMSDNDQEEYIEPNILGTVFEQYLTAEETTSATDADDAHSKIYGEIGALTKKWMNAETDGQRSAILGKIEAKESFLNPVSSTRYEAEQNARINQEFILPSLADMIEDGYKATYQENMKIEILNRGESVSAYPVGCAV